jgi:hypothetical protein
MRHTTIILTLLATMLASAATAVAAQRYLGYSGFEDVSVTGAQMTYRLRADYILPAKWKAARASSHAVDRRFGPVGSCRIRVTVRGSAAADAVESATARVARIAPAGLLADEGTRGNAAWRVTRARGGTRTITGVLVKPAPNVRTQPAGGRAWIELRAVGRIDPTTECHAGGPRSVAAAFGDMLASARIGGFQLR